jgi:GNAT superfamily N-acetyltransferase
MSGLRVRPLCESDAEVIASAFAGIGWDKLASRYRRYVREQERGERTGLAAFVRGEFAGYLTVSWRPAYRPFRLEGVPEIQDLNVLPRFRKRGVATRLMDDAEALIAARSSVAGVGVGLTADYGAAQRMYAKRGYVPDGNGLVASLEQVRYGQRLVADDDLVLYLTKPL